MRTGIITAALVLVAATTAQATFIEFETVTGLPNNTLGSAQLLPYNPGGADGFDGHDTYDVGIGALAAGIPGGDHDVYAFLMNSNVIFSAMTSGLDPVFGFPDTEMALYNQAGTLLVANDDGGTSNPGPNFSSAIRYYTNGNALQLYYLVVTGYNPAAMPATMTPNGSFPSHTEVGRYAVTLSILGCIPEPATLSLLGIGALALIRRRR